MKKLLTILGAVGLTATGATSAVVSCGTSSSVTDLASWKGELVGAKIPASSNLNADSQKSNLKATYATVGGLKKGIAFQLGQLAAADMDGGIKVFSGTTDKSTAATAESDDSAALVDTKYYFVSITATDASKKLKNKCEKTLVKAAGTKMDLKKVTTAIDVTFTTTTVATTDTTDSTAALKATNSVVKAISDASGIQSSLVSADFATVTDATKAIFAKADINKLKVGDNNSVKSNAEFAAKSDAKTFTGSIAKEMLLAKAGSLDISGLEGTYNIPLAAAKWNGSGASATLTADGVTAANDKVSELLEAVLNAKLSTAIEVITTGSDKALTVATPFTASTTTPGESAVTSVSINAGQTGADQLTGTVTVANLKFNLSIAT